MDKADDHSVPSIPHFFWPTLEALTALGGSANKHEINARVIESMGLTPAQVRVLEGDGPHTRVAKRLAWARTRLGKLGALKSDGIGLWELTDKGRAIRPDDIKAITAQIRHLYALGRHRGDSADGIAQVRPASEGEADQDLDRELDHEGPVGSEIWKDQLLRQLLDMPPASFERLCQRLLRAAGFVRVVVTGRGGDGGIDGIGQYQLALVSFPVVFQSKRYRGSVGPDKVREFRGAMAGRGDKGLLITTGTFTPDAEREAVRDGVPPVDLIDGDRLCDLLLQYGLGASSVAHVEIDADFLRDV